MKRFLILVVTLAMMLSLFACAKQPAQNQQPQPQTPALQVGFGRGDITPELGVPLGGYGNTEHRLATDILDKLYATCVAFKEGEETVLMFSMDSVQTVESWVYEVRTRIQRELGIKTKNIMVMSTHSHSTPEIRSSEDVISKDYWEIYMKGAVAAAKAAVEDLAPATVYGTSTNVEGMNFIRHYLMNDGTYAGPNFGDWSSGIKDHASENDSQMQLVKFQREGKKDILLMNWAAHPCFTGGIDKYDVSADYIGAVRDAIESTTDMQFIFLLAATGNHNGVSSIESENHNLNNKAYGQKLAEAAVGALDSMKKIEGQGISIKAKQLRYKSNQDKIELWQEAQEVYDLFHATGDRDAGNALARKYGLSSVYEASAIISRMSFGPVQMFEVSVTQVGGLSFVHAPYEMFAASGKYIKENSPYEMTIVATMANNGVGYFPTEPAFEYGCYESFTTKFAKGIAEFTAGEFVKLLNELKG